MRPYPQVSKRISSMRVSFVGAGNVGTHFAVALDAVGIQIVDITSKTMQSAERLANQVGGRAVTKVADMSDSVDAIILAVQDESIADCAKALSKHKTPIIHVSGATPLSEVSDHCENAGVMYPLQSFTVGHEVVFSKVPFFIEGSNEQVERLLTRLVVNLSPEITLLSSEQRLALHVAAVFTCNFSNALYRIAYEICDSHNISFSVLHPLMRLTVEKAASFVPHQVQTGPANRHDLRTLERHREHLSGMENAVWCELYDKLSRYILDNTYKSRKPG